MSRLSRWPVYTMIMSILIVVAVIIHAFRSSLDSYSVATSPSACTRDASTLQLVIVVSRHGNRSPLVTYPSYPYVGSAFWPFGDGQLTKRGRYQMFKLGSKIRSLYNGFLNETYSPELIRSVSTLYDRTLMSAQLFLAGLFPPKDYQRWNDQLLWQPIPVYPNYLDHTPDYTKCPRYMEELKVALAKYNKETEENYTAILKPTTSHTGQSFTAETLSSYIFNVQDSLYSADIEGYVLPDWSKDVYPEPISSLRANYLRQYVRGSDTITRLYQGTLFQDIVNSIQAKMDKTLKPDLRMMYYSGHDTTVLGVQAILGLFDDSEIKMVNTASALIFELHRNKQSGDYYLQTLFIEGGKIDLEPKVVEIPRCGEMCSVNILKTITEKFYNITDYKEECKINS